MSPEHTEEKITKEKQTIISDTNNQDKEQGYVQNLFELLQKYGPGKSEQEEISEIKDLPRQRFGNSLWMKVLLTYPYILLVAFIVSLLWDFPGMNTTLFGYTLHFEGLLKIITVSGLIGYGTNWLAITMLFRPLKRRPLLGQGLIPAQKDRIAYRLAEAVSRDLINPDLIKARISDVDIIAAYREKTIHNLKQIIDNPDFRRELKDLLIWSIKEQLNDDEFRNSLAESIISQLERGVEHSSFERLALKAYLIIRGSDAKNVVDQALLRVPDNLINEMGRLDEILDSLPKTIEGHSESIENVITELIFTLIGELDIHALIEDNIMKLDEGKLEALIKGTTNEQLQYIQYLGAVLGTLGGLVIWEPILSVTVMGLIVAIVVGLDTFLMNKGKQ